MQMEQTSKKRDNGRRRFVYAVEGLTEWIALISVGKAKVRIPFAGGSVSAYGTVPATFATDSHALMKIIENSNYFATGRIKRVQR